MKKYIKPTIITLNSNKSAVPGLLVGTAFGAGVALGLAAGPRDIFTPAVTSINLRN